MKKIYLMLIVLIVAVTSCTDQFADFNTDKKNPAVVPGESLFSNSQKELSDYINNTNVNINIFKLVSQYWTETTYIDEVNYDLITRNISTDIYSRVYLRVLKDLKESAQVISGTDVLASQEPVKQNKLQIIELMNVYTYLQLVDVFGNIPYSQALEVNNVYPKYDDAATIYKDLFKRVDAALAKLDVTSDGFGPADLYYGGDVASWIKFGNSLKIRMGITVADASDADLQATAKAAVESGASNCFASNDDDCLLKYLTSSPNYNQLYVDLVATGRHDFVAANTIVDVLNNLGDPRIMSYFTYPVTFPFATNALGANKDTTVTAGRGMYVYYKNIANKDSIVYKTTPFTLSGKNDSLVKVILGGQYGYSNSYSQASHIAAAIQKPEFPGIMLTYTEIQFYLAEAKERGYNVPKTAEEYYNEGIKSSFDFWGTPGVEAYLAKPEVAYTTASGTWKQKIGVQSWIANYTRGLEGYNTWRRLDYPIFNIPSMKTSYADIPVRFTYPVNEQTLNEVNYKAASAAIGGDLMTTKLFWDKY
ncbi:MAG: SusD/RagB family nutrient-binding outer membrane lipoprotein [Bacteroidota bacterium]|nr:SusD/RagB family nutrient-binding outer membrane lipoprotein [Bacteroidota bacterium]